MSKYDFQLGNDDQVSIFHLIIIPEAMTREAVLLSSGFALRAPRIVCVHADEDETGSAIGGDGDGSRGGLITGAAVLVDGEGL